MLHIYIYIFKFSGFFPRETSFTFISFEINEVSISRKKKRIETIDIESFAAYDVDQGVERSKIFSRVFSLLAHNDYDIFTKNCDLVRFDYSTLNTQRCARRRCNKLWQQCRVVRNHLYRCRQREPP